MTPLPNGIPTPERLLELIDRMVDQPIALVADLVVDHFIHGTPKRISREAPVLILQHDSEELIPGGGANAIANVAALDGRPLAFGVVGADRAGQNLLEVLRARGAEVSGIVTEGSYRTPTKTRILAGGRHAIKQQIVRYDIEDHFEPTADDDSRLLELINRLAARCRVLVLSDYGYGAVHPGLLPLLRRDLPDVSILGDSRYRLAELRGLDGATPNLEEAEKVLADARLGSTLEGGREILEAGGSALLDLLGCRYLLITRGSAGMSLFTADRVSHLPVHGTDQVADVTGAGDTVIGTFALALAAGGTPLEAAILANYAGGVVVMKIGTATLDRGELKQAIERDPELLGAIEQTRK